MTTQFLKASLCLIFTSIFYFTPLSAQNQVEVGIGTGENLLQGFSLTYKKQKKENKWFRVNSSFANVDYSNQNDLSLLNFNMGFSLGVEKRIQIGDSPVEFLRGPQGILRLGLAGLFDEDDTNKSISLGAGMGYVIGGQIHLKKGVKIGIETVPSIIIDWENRDDDDRINLNLGFNSNALNIFVVYNFEKKKKG